MIGRVLEVYRRWLSPALHSVSGAGGACRFQPTCSEYAAAAFAQHNAWRASLLVAWRLLRCNPLFRGGFDPVPPGPRSTYGAVPKPNAKSDGGGGISFSRGTDECRHLP